MSVRRGEYGQFNDLEAVSESRRIASNTRRSLRSDASKVSANGARRLRRFGGGFCPSACARWRNRTSSITSCVAPFGVVSSVRTTSASTAASEIARGPRQKTIDRDEHFRYSRRHLTKGRP